MNEGWRPTEEGMWLSHPPVPRIGEGRRVLHIATRFLRGGSERNIAHSIMWERAAGFEVELAVGAEADTLGIPATVPVHRVLALRPRVHPRDAAAFLHLRRLIRSGRYDVVHTHQSKAGILGRLAAGGGRQRVVHTVHMASFGRGYNAIASAAYAFAERVCSRLADVIVFVGAELLDQYVWPRIVRQKQAMLIRSPIDVESCISTRHWSDSQRQSARQLLGLGDAGPVLIAVGALEPRKGYDTMLRSLADFLMKGSGRLLIAGEGPLRSYLEGEAQALGLTKHVSFLGQIRDVPSALAVADLLVHASATEGVPQVVIQALAAGRPVVAKQATGLQEVPGAEVRIFEEDRQSMAAAVEAALRGAPPRAPEESFAGWTCSSIDGRHEALHRSLAAT